MNKLFVLLLILFSMTNAYCQANRTENWSKDIDFLIDKIKKEHYVYKSKALPEAFYKKVEILKANIAAYTDERMLIEIQALMYYLEDGHSYMFPFITQLTQTHFLPIHFYEFSDGMYVIDSDSAHSHLIGMKIMQIGKTTPKKLMKDMVTFISQDNTIGAKWIGPFYLRFRGLLEAYGLENGAKEIGIKFKDANNRVFEEKVNFIPVPPLRGMPKMKAPKNATAAPYYLQNVQSHYWFKELPEKKALYFQFNQVFDEERESLANFTKRLSDEISAKKPQLLVVDVRHNNGGDGYLLPPLLKVIQDYEQIHKGKVVVITSRNTFSAAQIFISKLDLMTNAIFVGEASSSSPNFVGEENAVVLPYSGAVGSISNRYHENIPNDTRKWIEPSLKISLSSKDFFNNQDPILEAVLKKYGSI